MTTKVKPATRFLIALAVVMFGPLIFQWSESTKTQTLLPPVMTDKTGYLLGEPVLITGTGYTPGDVFTLQVTHADGTAEAGMGHEPFQAVVGDDGTFTATWGITEEDDAGHDFVLNATGGIAGAAPAWTFGRIATVGTDKFDYQPGETAIIVGAGFDAGETVTITIEHSNASHGGLHPPMEVAADLSGSVVAQWYVEPETSKDSLFRLTAVGAESALVATTTFTDALVMLNDDSGPDDFNGQRDLSFMGVDAAPTTGDLGVTWGWDDSAFNGANTGDACALFDTNGDNFANYVLCVTVRGNPAAQVASPVQPRLFSCNNTASDRCNGNVQIPIVTSTSTASVVANSDPFRTNPAHIAANCTGTNCVNNDTVANLTVRFSDFVVAPGFSVRLRNVCSYNSNNPNSGAGDCAAAPTNGFLTIKKTTQTPFSASTAFVFNSSRASQNGTTSWTANVAGAQTDFAVASLVSFAPGLLNLSEVVPANWDLTDATCVVQGSTPTSTGTFSGTTVTGVSIQTGLETICTFTNERQNSTPTAVDDTAEVAEDSGATTIDVLDNDTDPDGDTLSVTAATDPANGSVSITNGGADVSYTPDANFFGTDTFIYTVSDGNGGTDTATVTVTVTSVNDDPVANNDSATVNEDSTATAIDVLGNDTFAPDTGETLSVTGVSDPPNGTAAFTTTGVTYTPDANFFGTDTFTYNISDGNGGTATATVTVTVNAVNDAPSFSKGLNQTVNEDSGPHTVAGWATAISAGPANESSQTVTFVVTNNTNPSLFSAGPAVAADGTLSYSLAANANGTADISVKITDDGGVGNGGVNESGVQTFTIAVNAVNDAPSFTKGADDTVNEDSGARSVPGWASTISAGPSDESGQTLTFNVSNDNSALFSVQPSITAGGQLSYTPAPNAFGTANVTVTLSDSGGTANGGVDTSAAQTFIITVNAVNDAPTFTKGGDQVVNEDSGPHSVAWATDVSAGPANESSQMITFVVTNNTNPSLFSAGPAVAADGTLSYTLAANANGSADVSLKITDDGGTANDGVNESGVQTFTITVNAVNDPPSFTKGADDTVNEDSGPRSVPSWASAISAGPADEAGQALTFNVSNDNNALFAVQPAITPSGALSYTPAPDAFGMATVSVSLSDDGGVANGGVDTSAAQTFVITINAVNDAPSFTKGGDQVVNEDSGPHSVAWATGISSGPANESAQVLSFVITANDNPSLFAAGPAVAADGTLSYSLAANANGSATISVKITDDGGTANGGVDESAPQTFTITVNPVNDAPSFTAGANETVNEDSGARSVPGWATAVSAGPPDESGQTLTFTVSNDTPSLFSVQPSLTATGDLSYTPAPDAFGTAIVTVTLSDNGGTTNGGVDSSTPQMFTITVNAINDMPSFTKGPDQSVLEDAGAQTVSGWATGISAGPNESSQTVSFEITANTNPSLFAVGPTVQADGTLSYTPAANEFGTASITLVIKDDGGTANGGQDTSAPQTFVIDVTPVNDAPTFTRGADQTVPEDAGPQTVAGWATSMSAGPSNESAQTLSFSTTNTNNGLFSAQPSVANDGTLTFTSAPNAHGTATVTVRLTDSGGTANGGDNDSEQSFVITITPVNDAPASVTAGASPASIDENQSATVSGAFTDPDSGDTHTVTIVWGDGSPNTTLNLAAGVFSYSATHQYKDDNPTATAVDINTVSVTVTDNGSPQGTGSANTTVTVNNVAPVITSVVGPATPQPINTPIAVTAHFTDVGTQDTHTCAFEWDDPPQPNTTGVAATETNGSGSCTASHTFASPGVYSVKVTVTDDDTGSDTEKLDLEYIVVFDPNGGFVTGGGWIMSPPGASPAYPTATGKANFGFVSKYKKGSNVPEGQTEFQFKAGDLNFHSSAYDYGSLVVTGHKAVYRGTGTVNGVPGFRFVLIAYDGQQPGGGGIDKFRIKITMGGTLIYDNRNGFPEDVDTADPMAISGGSIVIHDAKGK